MIIIRKIPLREKRDIGVVTPLESSVRKACRRQAGIGVDVTAHFMSEPSPGALLWVAIAIAAFGPGADGSGEVDDNATLTL